MKANELRIGNLVRLNNPEHQKQFHGRVCEVKGFNVNHADECIVWLKVSGELPLHEKCVSELCQFLHFIDPIPLTPELLERCGFVKDGDFDNGSVDYYRKDCIHIQFPNYEGWDIYYVWRDNIVDDKGERKQYHVVLAYLHQLQNLFYCLTRNELEVKM